MLGMPGGALVGPVGAVSAGAASQSALDPSIDAGQSNPLWLPPLVLAYMRQDAAIALALKVTKAPFSSIPWTFEGGDKKIRDALNAAILPLIPGWLPVLLRALDFGWSAAEIPWDVGELAVRRLDERQTLMAEAYLVAEELLDLDPLTTTLRADERGRLTGAHTLGGEVPADKLLLVVNEKEGGGLLGRALATRAYQQWRQRLRSRLDLVRYLESKGNPPLIGEAPDEEIVDPETGQKVNAIDIVLAALANLRGGGAYVLPSTMDTVNPNAKKYNVRALEVADRASEFETALKLLQQEIFIGMLVPPSMVGDGAFAGAKVAERVFYASLDTYKHELVCDPINRQVAARFVAANFGKVERCDMPKLKGGDPSENAKELLAEILKSALTLHTKGELGALQQVASLVDYGAAMDTCGIPRLPPERVPSAEEVASVAAQQTPTGQPAAGRPSRITREDDRPDAPSRPGLSREAAIALARSAPVATPEEYFAALEEGLRAIDEAVWQAERLAESERVALEAEIRNLMRKAVARAKKDGDRLSAANRTLAKELEAEVAEAIRGSIFDDLLDEKEITRGSLGLSRGPASPLAAAHAASFKAASDLLASLGLKPPAGASALRIVKDVVRDANHNGRGVVQRESRRVAESLDRLIMSEAPVETAEATAEAYTLPRHTWTESTTHHVRATARATLAAGEPAAAELVVSASEATEREITQRWPSGKVAQELWTVRTPAQLDARDRAAIAGGHPATSWRNLGKTFFSEEMYTPVPARADLRAGILRAAEERRAAFLAAAETRQEKLTALRAQRGAKGGGASGAGGGSAGGSQGPDPAASSSPPSAPPPLARPAPAAPATPVTVNLTIANQPADVRLEQPIHVHPPAPAAAPPAPPPAQVIVQNQPAPVNVELTVDARPAAGGAKKVTVVRDADGQIRSAEITPENPPAGAA